MDRRDFLKRLGFGVTATAVAVVAPETVTAVIPKVVEQEISHYDGIYMLRNVIEGDEEQTRIDDNDYLGQLPKDLEIMARYWLDDHGDYDTACEIYIRHMLKDLTPERFLVELEDFLEDWKSVYESFGPDDKYDCGNGYHITDEDMVEALEYLRKGLREGFRKRYYSWHWKEIFEKRRKDKWVQRKMGR